MVAGRWRGPPGLEWEPDLRGLGPAQGRWIKEARRESRGM